MSQARGTVSVDDDRVRVTTRTFEAAGIATGRHRHEFDYVIVPITGGTFTVVGADGSNARWSRSGARRISERRARSTTSSAPPIGRRSSSRSSSSADLVYRPRRKPAGIGTSGTGIGRRASLRRTVLGLLAVVSLVVPSSAGAITFGQPDLDNQYPNVASVRGIVEATNTARVSCSGSLLHRDAEKVVILTAAHCTDAWADEIAAGTLDSVGVSFDKDNQVPDGTTMNATFYVRGGVPISFPAKDAPFEKFDYGLVVFPTSAENAVGETIFERWGALTPVQVSPTVDYLSDLIAGVRNPTRALSFTAVGYGTGEKFPIPGEETGPANPAGTNNETFLRRFIADGLTYNAHNPRNDVLRLSQNIAKGEPGTCNGDSGGPIFYEDPNLGRVQVSAVSGGDFPCKATNTGPGFSRPEAFAFIGCASVEGDTSAVAACVDNRFGS